MKVNPNSLGLYRELAASDARSVRLNQQSAPEKGGPAMKGRQAKLQNTEVRQHFAAALAKAYPKISEKLIGRLLDPERLSTPLSGSEIRRAMDTIDAKKILGNAQLTVGPDKQIVPISPGMIPRSLLEAHKGDVTGLVTQLQAKVDRGSQLVQDLRDNAMPSDHNCTVKDATDIAWFVQVAGQAKIGARYVSGATTMSDPGGRIRSFLDHSGESYSRASSHLKGAGGFQTLENGFQRGLDCEPKDGNLDALLPNNRTTVLYGRIAQSDKLRMPEERLYFKIEAHGCRLGAPSALRTRNSIALRGAPQSLNSKGPQNRETRDGDLKQALLHSLDFFAGGSADSVGAVNRRETVPGELKSAFKKLIKSSSGEVRKALKEGKPLTKSTGIRFMLQNAETALNLAKEAAEDGLSQRLTSFIDGLKNSYDPATLHLRIGEEVIL